MEEARESEQSMEESEGLEAYAEGMFTVGFTVELDEFDRRCPTVEITEFEIHQLIWFWFERFFCIDMLNAIGGGVGRRDVAERWDAEGQLLRFLDSKLVSDGVFDAIATEVSALHIVP